MPTARLDVDDLGTLAQSWMLSLRAERKSPQTLKNYGDGVRFYLHWCQQGSRDPLARDSLRAWVAELVETGMAPATIRARQLPVRRFAAWLADEGEIPADPFLGLRSPKLDVKVVEPLSDDQLRRLIAACQPPTGATPQVALRHRRDEAIVRLMLETGAARRRGRRDDPGGPRPSRWHSCDPPRQGRQPSATRSHIITPALLISRLEMVQALTVGTDRPILPISLREHGIRAGPSRKRGPGSLTQRGDGRTPRVESA